MNNNFIRNIKIHRYKYFENFEANGFKRVNLIGGKNNVGKTAFMEAMFIPNSISYSERATGKNSKERDKLHFEIIKALLFIDKNRKKNLMLSLWSNEEFKFDFKDLYINLNNDKIKISLEDNIINIDRFTSVINNMTDWNDGGSNLLRFRDNKFYHTIYYKNKLPVLDIYNFIPSQFDDVYFLQSLIDDLKIKGIYNIFIKKIALKFEIEDISWVDKKNSLMIQENGKYISISEYGDGIIRYLTIIATLLFYKDSVIFIDELENGIHYSNFNQLWQEIFTISKEQNVQVFATTHSKECIESYYKVSKDMEENDVSFINLSKNKQNEIIAIVLDSEMLYSEIEQNHELRAW
jgi:AAA15 family ATPase/GTPase